MHDKRPRFPPPLLSSFSSCKSNLKNLQLLGYSPYCDLSSEAHSHLRIGIQEIFFRFIANVDLSRYGGIFFHARAFQEVMSRCDRKLGFKAFIGYQIWHRSSSRCLHSCLRKTDIICRCYYIVERQASSFKKKHEAHHFFHGVGSVG